MALLLRLLSILLIITFVNAQGPEAEEKEELIFVSAAFHHGTRAPDRTYFNSPEFDKEAFPYGMGELTETGIRRSFELGRFLQARYVDNIFLSQNLNNKEVYFQSVDIPRSLMSAEALAQGMFSPSGRLVPLPIPVHTRPLRSDWMLAFPWDKCSALQSEFGKYCVFPETSEIDSYPKYQAALFECMGAKGKYFNDTNSFNMIDNLVAQELAGSKLPMWYQPYHRLEARAVQAKTQRFQLGLGEYHNPTVLRVTAGQMFDTMLKEILHKWNCLNRAQDPNCIAIQPLKFKAISTQDYVLNSLLEIMGARREALGRALQPQYNSIILVELWNVRGQPMIKILFKRGSHTNQLVNVSGNTRNCRGVIACPLEEFASCCDDYRTANPMEDCMMVTPFPTAAPQQIQLQQDRFISTTGVPPLPDQDVQFQPGPTERAMFNTIPIEQSAPEQRLFTTSSSQKQFSSDPPVQFLTSNQQFTDQQRAFTAIPVVQQQFAPVQTNIVTAKIRAPLTGIIDGMVGTDEQGRQQAQQVIGVAPLASAPLAAPLPTLNTLEFPQQQQQQSAFPTQQFVQQPTQEANPLDLQNLLDLGRFHHFVFAHHHKHRRH